MAMEEIRERYELAMERIRAMKQEKTVSAPFYAYFQKMADFILEMDAYRASVEKGEPERLSLAELQEQNRRLYGDVAGGSYRESYANPTGAVEKLGEGYGQILSFVYTELRGMIIWAVEGRLTDMTVTAELFIELYNAFEEDTPSVENLKEILYWHMSDYCDVFIPDRIREQLDPSLDFAAKLIRGADLSDPRYLYRFGEYITENELGVSRFLAGLSQSEIDAMASTFTEGYRMGFVAAGIDLSKKKTVNIRYALGFERVVKAAIGQFEKMGLRSVKSPIFNSFCFISSLCNVSSTFLLFLSGSYLTESVIALFCQLPATHFSIFIQELFDCSLKRRSHLVQIFICKMLRLRKYTLHHA